MSEIEDMVAAIRSAYRVAHEWERKRDSLRLESEEAGKEARAAWTEIYRLQRTLWGEP